MARLEIQIVGNNENLKQVLKETKASLKDFSNLGIDAKPLSAYQAGLLKIKQEALELTKQKEADRKAQAALNAEIKEQQKAQRAANDEANKRKPTQVSNSQAEIDAYVRAKQGSISYTTALNAERVAKAQLNTEAAKQAIANNTLNTGVSANVTATNQQTQATNQNVLSKKQLAQALAEERLRQANATAELKNNAREMLNAKGSLEQRRAALIRLVQVYAQLSKAERESASGTRLSGIISGLKDQIKGIQDQTKGGVQPTLFDSIKSNALGAIGPLALLTAALATAKASFSHNVEISDDLADVQRVAALSAKEVDGLSKELQGLDTRTDLKGLLDIGFIGGRLKVPKEDLKDFIKEVDELGVVLKREFPGGAEAVAESLGKIVTIYKITEKEGVSFGTALTKIGSNFLGLAHSGPVTVKYLQDFTLGIAGTAATAKLALPVVSAYGAVLGESGQIASSAALAVTRLVNDLSVKRGKYYAIAQIADATLTVDKFNNLINTDTQGALTAFFKGLKAGNPTVNELNDRLASVGIKTGKVSNAVKILAENQDKLNSRIQSGTKDYVEHDKVAHNFEIRNNTLAASVDKLSNSFVNLTTNPNGSVGKFFKGIIDGATYSIRAISELQAALDKTQQQEDDSLIRKSTSLKGRVGGYLFGGDVGTNSQEFKDAIARRKQRGTDALNNNIADQGFAKADQLARGKSEVEIRKQLTAEVNREVIARNRLANALKFVSDPKNTQAQVAPVSQNINKLRADARRQNAVVKRLRSKLPNGGEVYGDGSLVDQTKEDDARTIDDIKADIKRVTELKKPLDTASKQYKDYVKQIIGFKKELALANGAVPKAPAIPKDFKSLILSEMSKAENYDALVGLEGLDKTNEKTTQKYKALNDNLNKLQKEYNQKYKAGSKEREQFDALTASARAVNATNQQNELTQNAATFAKKQADIIAGIEQEAGITRIVSQEQEIQQNAAHYADLTRQYEGNAAILAVLVDAKAQEEENIRNKYRQKRLEAEQNIQEKIADVLDKGFDSSTGSKKSQAKLDKDLKERLTKVTKFYDDLKELNKNNPLALIGIGASEAGAKGKLKQDAATASKTDFGNQLSGVAVKFGDDLIETLTKANAFADKSFSDVISGLATNLTDSLNQVFIKKFGDQLTKLLDKAFDSLSANQQALAGGAIVLGSIIGGITKKTSAIGQGTAGALKGAGTGALLGTAVGGPAGTVAGAVIGGVAGLIGGIFGASKAKKQEELQKQQLAEEKKQTALQERANALAYSSSIIGRNTVNGVVTGVEINEFGQLTTKIAGQDLLITLDRAAKSRQRGT